MIYGIDTMRVIYQNRGTITTLVLTLPDPVAGFVKQIKPPKIPKKQNRRKKKPTDHYAKFKDNVLKRCNHQCVACGAKQDNTRLVVHHLNSYAVFDDLALDPDNGVSLCPTCDGEFHGKYGTIGNTRTQFMEWMGSK